MIDLRCHLFDGTPVRAAADLTEPLLMCRQAAREGVRTIVAVERWEPSYDETPPLLFDAYRQRLERLQSEVGDALQLRQGFVFRFHPELSGLIERYGSSVTLGGGRHVLVALPATRTPAGAEELWESLQRRGFSVVVAGPECSHDLRRKPGRLESWLEGGVKLQLNAASITGAHGREAQRFALHCAKEYRGHVVIASNAREAGERAPSLAAAREALRRQLGRETVEALFHETAAAMLEPARDEHRAERRTSGASRLLQQIFRLRKAATDAP
jgi:tyrosine-protein phosphatase YwqE